ncbi:hypothetical protein F4604DRAFT_1614118 [Suillus subluteus]|nr:hypothetical protein F4604DRAFT_1614118 [Suillus subluteus]
MRTMLQHPLLLHQKPETRDRDAAQPRSRSRSRSPGARSTSYRSPQKGRSPPPEKLTHAPIKAPNPSQVLGVFGLSIRTQERYLDEEFSRFGRFEKVTIVYDQRSDRSRGFGFIRMSSTEEATRYIQELNGALRFPFMCTSITAVPIAIRIGTATVTTAVIGAIVAALVITHLITGGAGATPGILLGVVALARIMMVLQALVRQAPPTRLKTVVVGDGSASSCQRKPSQSSKFISSSTICLYPFHFHIALLLCSTLSTFASVKSGKSRIAIARKVRHNNPARSDSAHMQPRECWQACGRLHKPS